MLSLVRSTLQRHEGRKVVAHLATFDIAGRLRLATRETVVLDQAVMLSANGGEAKSTPLDGEQHIDVRGLWVQVEP